MLEGEVHTAPFLELNITIRKHFKYNLSLNVYSQAVSTPKVIIFGI